MRNITAKMTFTDHIAILTYDNHTVSWEFDIAEISADDRKVEYIIQRLRGDLRRDIFRATGERLGTIHIEFGPFIDSGDAEIGDEPPMQQDADLGHREA